MYDRDPHPTAIDFICCRFVSPSAAYLHISLAPYRPSPSITVSSDPRLVYVYVYTYAYANVNVLALPPPSRIHPLVPDWFWDFLDHLAHPRLLLPLTERIIVLPLCLTLPLCLVLPLRLALPLHLTSLRFASPAKPSQAPNVIKTGYRTSRVWIWSSENGCQGGVDQPSQEGYQYDEEMNSIKEE
ncbi:hypothetical protein B0H13DRAFT_2334156 [Mycena leptocephala]|nr:hypothetical protein B0H13DRAFT_2334156 [Mycena leptocephala]